MGEVVKIPEATNPGSAGHLLRLLRDGSASTNPQLAELTGVSRSTIAQRVDALLAHGLVVEDGQSASTGGRPATRLRFNEDRGLILVGDIGATHSRVGITDLACRVLV